MINDLLIAFGISSSVIPRLWLPVEIVDPNQSNNAAWKTTARLSVLHSTLELYKRQLLPGAMLDKFGEKLLKCLNESLCWEFMISRYQIAPTGRIERVSLKGLCDVFLVDAITRTIFGDCIYDIEPDLIQYLLDFNESAWMLVFKYPLTGAPKLRIAKDKILKALAKYLQAPDNVRSGQSWLIEKVMEDLNAVHVAETNGAALLLMIYWGYARSFLVTIHFVEPLFELLNFLLDLIRVIEPT